MDQPSTKYTPVIRLYLLLAFFAVPHLIDDFLYGIPKEFGISIQLAQFLGGGSLSST